jgi:hypothetical protein
MEWNPTRARACGIKFGGSSELILLPRAGLYAWERDATSLTSLTLHGVVKSNDVGTEFSAAVEINQCFVEPNSVHFAVALIQCSIALILVLQRDMIKKYPVVHHSLRNMDWQETRCWSFNG